MKVQSEKLKNKTRVFETPKKRLKMKVNLQP